MKDNIVWIHKELSELDKVDRAKVGIEFFVRNLRQRRFSDRELDELSQYFAREVGILKERVGRNYT